MKRFSDLLINSFTVKLSSLLIIIAVIALSIFIYENPEHQFKRALNSNYFFAIITGLTGTIAFFIYFKQKIDTKRDASKTILAEIINSEKVIQDVKNIKKYSGFINLEPDPMKFYLGNFSWNQYKYLFIGAFDAYEWEKINLYFSQSTVFNETIKNIANLLPQNLEFRMQSVQQELARIASEQADKISELEKMDGKNNKVIQDQINEISARYEQKGKDFVFGYIDAEKTSLKYVYTPAMTITGFSKFCLAI